jgi:hypothetical protein
MSMVAGSSRLGIGPGVDPLALAAGVPQDEQKRPFANNSTPQDEQYPITFVCNSLLQPPRVRRPGCWVLVLEGTPNRFSVFALVKNALLLSLKSACPSRQGAKSFRRILNGNEGTRGHRRQ